MTETVKNLDTPVLPLYGPRGPILDSDQEVRTFAAEKAGAILRNVGTVFARGDSLDVLDVIRLAAYIEHGLDYLDIVSAPDDEEPVVEESPSTWQ